MMYDELIKRLRDDVGIDGRAEMMKQAAYAIEELSKPRWIPATERLPEMRAWEDDGLPCSSNVLFRTDRTIHIGYVIEDSYEDEYAGNVKLYKWYMQGGFRIENVTHWMPLPSPPAEE